MTDAERDAKELLEAVWMEGDSSAIRLPVDPFYIAKRLGIGVYEDPSLGKDISGVLRKNPFDDPEIVLNSNEHRNRQRFTCAHELGHYTKRSNQRGEGDGAWDYVDHRNFMSSTGKDPEEVYANQFAAALLMPSAAIDRMPFKTVAAMAYEFGVSEDAMNWRLDHLQRHPW
jgi:Zn-dependent peptidase ImmA (M78 family)